MAIQGSVEKVTSRTRTCTYADRLREVLTLPSGRISVLSPRYGYDEASCLLVLTTICKYGGLQRASFVSSCGVHLDVLSIFSAAMTKSEYSLSWIDLHLFTTSHYNVWTVSNRMLINSTELIGHSPWDSFRPASFYSRSGVLEMYRWNMFHVTSSMLPNQSIQFFNI